MAEGVSASISRQSQRVPTSHRASAPELARWFSGAFVVVVVVVVVAVVVAGFRIVWEKYACKERAVLLPAFCPPLHLGIRNKSHSRTGPQRQRFGIHEESQHRIGPPAPAFLAIRKESQHRTGPQPALG